MEAITTQQVGRYTVRTHYDDDPESPRDWDNLGTLSGSARGTIFDEAPEASAAAAYLAARSAHGPILALPVYVHSQAYTIVQETGDWGYADGIYFVPLAKVAEEYPGTFAEQVTSARHTLRAELKNFNAYLAGEVYGYTVTGPEGLVDSCWDFIGDEEYALSEGLSVAEEYTREYEALPEWVRRHWAILDEPALVSEHEAGA